MELFKVVPSPTRTDQNLEKDEAERWIEVNGDGHRMQSR